MSGKKRAFSETDGDHRDAPERIVRRRVEDSPSTTSKDEPSSLQYPSKGQQIHPVAIQYPSRLLTFSYNAERTLLFDDSSMKYHVHPPPNADLRYGYARWIKRPEEKGRLDGLLKAILRHAESLDCDANESQTPSEQSKSRRGEEWLRQINFVSWRGVMTKILTAPHEERDGWDLNVMHIDDTMYLEEHLSNQKLAEKEDMAPNHRLQSYYGYSYESYCTSSHPRKPELLPGHPPGWSGDINTNVQWCSVVKTKLASYRLLIGGEVDCVNGSHLENPVNKSWNPETYVELKTSMAIRGPQDEVKFEKKLLKFYFQSFLLGVPEIIVGFRTPQGRLIKTQSFKTMELPRLVRGKPHAWDPHLCMHWGDTFLRFIREHVPSRRSQDKEHSVWRVKFVPGTGITLRQLDEAGVVEVESTERRVGFLPEWYFAGLQGPVGHSIP